MTRFAIDCELPCFKQDLEDAVKGHPSVREDLSQVVEQISGNPRVGKWIPGIGAEVRKMRVGVKKENIGKRGGFRLIYLVQPNKLTLLFFYFKPEKADIEPAEIIEAMKKWGFMPAQSSQANSSVN